MKFSLLFSLIVTSSITGIFAFEPDLKLIKEFNWKYVLKYFVGSLRKMIDSTEATFQCKKHLNALITGITQKKIWALKMIDSTAKIHAGLFQAGSFFHGNLDQCLSINEAQNGENIRGKYCHVAVLSPNKNNFSGNFGNDVINIDEALDLKSLPPSTTFDYFRSLRGVFALCLPDSCSVESLKHIWDHVDEAFNMPLKASFSEELCQHEEKPIAPFDVDFYIYLFFAFVFIIVTLSTIYDLYWHCPANGNSLLTMFSLYTNGNKLFSTSNNKNSLDCLNGIKTLSMLWVILGHRLLVNQFTVNINGLSTFIDMKDNYWNSFFVASPLAVDTFFTVTGILLMYLYLTIPFSQNISIWKLYLLRYLRFAPAQAATVMFSIGILKHLSSGPFWPLIAKKVALCCYRNWFSTMLQITNFHNFGRQCIETTWYTAVDFQLYLLSPLILFNIRKYPKTVIFCILAAITSSMVSAYVLTIKHQLGAVVIQYSFEFASVIYLSTFHRMPPWLIGILFGYVITKIQSKQNPIAASTTIFLTALSLIFMLLIILSHTFISSNRYNPHYAAIYNAFARPLWSLYVGTIILCCILNKNSLISKFLSARCFSLTGKLTYSMLLVHVSVIIISENPRRRVLNYYHNFGTFHNFLGDVVLTLVLSIPFCLIFESPVINLLKMKKNSGSRRKGKLR